MRNSTMSDKILNKLINDKFNKLGKSSCREKENFLFELKAMYGDTFNIDNARILYEELYLIKFEGDCNDN